MGYKATSGLITDPVMSSVGVCIKLGKEYVDEGVYIIMHVGQLDLLKLGWGECINKIKFAD